jgi:hypothetical protein
MILRPCTQYIFGKKEDTGPGRWILIFEGRDQGHISTRQIQRLLDKAAERAGFKRRGRAR